MLKAQAKVLILCTLLLLSPFPVTIVNLVNGQSSLFQMWLIVPGANPSRKFFAEMVENSLDSVGIDAKRVELPFSTTVYDRVLDPNNTVMGKTYLQGGFDALFVGYAMGIDPDPSSLYESSQFPPGQNYYLWNNSESDRLGRLIEGTTDEATRLQYVRDWQRLAYNEQPSATLYYTQEIVAYDPTALQGESFTAYHYPVWPGVEKWKLNASTTQTSIVLSQTGPAPGEGFNPLLTTSYYDLTVWGAVFDGLTQRNDTIGKQQLPDLATDWSVASDQKTWTVHLRQGATWHDGVKFNATDVKFTYDSLMNDALASPTGAFVKQIIGSPDNVRIIGEYTVEFDLPKPYAYFVSSIMDRTSYGAIVPYHVLKDMPLSLWRTHPFNTGSSTYTVNTGNGSYTAYGPIGTGPYTYMGYDPSTFSNLLRKNGNYWNRAALESAGNFGIQHYYVQWIEDSEPAISALKSGDIDVLDSQYELTSKTADIQSPWGALASYDAYGVQELGFNMQHPIFGTGVDTPLGKQDPSRAAEAARYVRQAISHLIPRQTIINATLNGYATLGITTPITRATIGFDSSLQPYSYDVGLAKGLLAAAGYDTGVPAVPEFLPTTMLPVLVISSVLVVITGRIMKRKPTTI